jgi:hypothetical protein
MQTITGSKHLKNHQKKKDKLPTMEMQLETKNFSNHNIEPQDSRCIFSKNKTKNTET